MGPPGHEPCLGATHACKTNTTHTMKHQPTRPDSAGDFENIRYETTHPEADSHPDNGRRRRQTQYRNRPQNHHRDMYPPIHQTLYLEDHSQPWRSEQHRHPPSQTGPLQQTTENRPPLIYCERCHREMYPTAGGRRESTPKINSRNGRRHKLLGTTTKRTATRRRTHTGDALRSVHRDGTPGHPLLNRRYVGGMSQNKKHGKDGYKRGSNDPNRKETSVTRESAGSRSGSNAGSFLSPKIRNGDTTTTRTSRGTRRKDIPWSCPSKGAPIQCRMEGSPGRRRHRRKHVLRQREHSRQKTAKHKHPV